MAAKTKAANVAHVVRVFVYGSLKRHLGNHGLMKSIDAKFIAHDTITGKYTMVSFGGFPAVCERTEGPDEPVYGEIYEIRPENLNALDALEGHPRWYQRKKLVTDSEELRAWMYVMPEAAIRHHDVVDRNMWRPTPGAIRHWAMNGVEFGESAR